MKKFFSSILEMTTPDVLGRNRPDFDTFSFASKAEGDTDYANNTTTEGVITFGEVETGNLPIISGTGPNATVDEDWFAISLTSGAFYNINTNFSDALVNGLVFTLYDANGTFIQTLDVFMDPFLLDESISFTASYTGNAFLGLSIPSEINQTIPYSFSVSSSVNSTDDYAADTSTNGAFVAGDTFNGTLEIAIDSDWFAIDLTEGEILFLSTGAEFNLEIYDSNGARVSGRSSTDFVSFTTLEFTAGPTGTYYAAISGVSGSSPISYDVTSQIVTEDIAGDSSTTAIVTVGETYTGRINFMEDVDWVAIDLIANEEYLLLIEESGNSDFALIDSSGNVLQNFGQSETPFSVMSNDTYFVSISNLFTDQPEYAFRALTIPEDLPDDATTTATLTASQTVESYSEDTSDRDYIRFDASDIPSDAVYVTISSQFANVQLVDADNRNAGDVIDLGHDVTTGLTTLIIAPFFDVTGDKFLLVSSNTGLYELAITGPVPDDYSASPNNAGVIIDGQAVANFDYISDTDWFEFSAEAADVLNFALEGSGFVPIIVVDENGNDTRFDDITTIESGNDDGSYTYYFVEGGTYYVSVTHPFGFPSGENGQYTLNVEEIEDDAGNSVATAATLALDETLTVEIEYQNDLDYVSFTLEAGQAYAVTIEAAGSNNVQPFFLSGYDENGDIYSSSNGFEYYEFGDSVIFVPRVDGVYTVAVPGEVWGNQFTLGDATNLSLSVIEDDLGETADGAPLVGVNEVLRTEHEYLGDKDAVLFDVSNGEDVIVSYGVLGVARVYDAQGNLRIELQDEDSFNTADYNLEDGRYTLVMDSLFFDGSGGQTGLNIVSVYTTVDDYGDTFETAGDITVGTNLIGALTPLPNGELDIDYIRVELSAEQNIDFGALLQNEQGYNIGLFDAAGNLVSANTDANGNIIGTFGTATVPTSGTYVFAISNISGQQNGTYELIVSNVIRGDAESNILQGDYGFNRIVGGDGDDVIYGDTPIALTGIAGDVYRAYQAVFDRAPDLQGFAQNSREIEFGTLTQEAMIESFVASQEFIQTYGTLTNREFVEQLYLNVLNREGDSVGVDAFVAAIEAGRSRENVVIEFANTPEFVQLMAAPSAAFGTNMIINPAEGEVYRIYQAVFNRTPDAGGFEAFVNALQAGTRSSEDITLEFVNSAEFLATYGNLSNSEFVELLFTNVLPGNMDQIGRAAFTAALDGGELTQAAMVVQLVASEELRNRTADEAADFVAQMYASAEDVILGSAGNDIMYGGRGKDVFVYNIVTDGNDTILDFQDGVDRILFQLDPNESFDPSFYWNDKLQQVGADLVITFTNGNSLTLINFDMEDFDNERFFATFDSDFGNATKTSPEAELNISSIEADFWDTELFVL